MAGENERGFRKFFVENLIYTFCNYLFILKVHLFSNSQWICYRNILKNERIAAALPEGTFLAVSTIPLSWIIWNRKLKKILLVYELISCVNEGFFVWRKLFFKLTKMEQFRHRKIMICLKLFFLNPSFMHQINSYINRILLLIYDCYSFIF